VILALDTTCEYGSIAIARGGQVLEVEEIHSPDGFGHVIFPRILALLDRCGTRLADIECYAAASGPGSFTGVRIGLTAVKGLAEAHGKRVVPVSNLKALAYAGAGEVRAPLIDARRGEIYGAVYDARLRLLLDEVVAPFERFLELLAGREATFVSTGFQPAAGLSLVTVSRALAAPIAGLAARAFASGQALPPEAVDANYIRRSDAELKWKDPGLT
jgi:tRNA threonylcarbamoyladenosine biosynthesis protein TsaB